MDKVLSYLGIARKAGYLLTGEENCGAAVRTGKARLLLLAQDASANAVSRAEGFLRGKMAPLLRLPLDKEELSRLLGRPGCSMVVLTDAGLASSLARALAEATGAPEHQEAARALAARWERLRSRRRPVGGKGKSMTGKRRKTV